MILFLDFDGVLHHENVTLKRCHPAKRRHLSEHKRRFLTRDGKLAKGKNLFEHADRLAAALAPFPDVRIVISSTWREHFRPDALLNFLPPSLADRVIGHTPLCSQSSEDGTRLSEVELYMDGNGLADEAWIALDDQARLFLDDDLICSENLFLLKGDDGLPTMRRLIFAIFCGINMKNRIRKKNLDWCCSLPRQFAKDIFPALAEARAGKLTPYEFTSNFSEIPLNLGQIVLPIAFAAANCQFVSQIPGSEEEYWVADIKAVRRKAFCKVFTRVLFVERPGKIVYLAGIDNPKGIDRYLQPEAAEKQSEFIKFLRDENTRENDMLGLLPEMFLGHGYHMIGNATAAYLAARGLMHPFEVGYEDDDGNYQLIQIEPGPDSGFDGTMFLSFDEMGKD